MLLPKPRCAVRIGRFPAVHELVNERPAVSSGYLGERVGLKRRVSGAALGNAFESTSVAVASDLFVISVSMILAILVVSGVHDWSLDEIRSYFRVGLISLAAWLLVFQSQRMFDDRIDLRMIIDVRRVVRAVVMGAMAMILVSWPLRAEISRLWMFVVIGIMIPALLVERQLFRLFGQRRRKAGIGLTDVVIMGTNDEANFLANTLDNPQLGSRVVGFIATEPGGPDSVRGVPVLHAADPAMAASAFGAQKVVIAATAMPGAVPTRLLRGLLDRGMRVELTSALTDVEASRISFRAVGRQPVISLKPGQQSGWRAAWKRLFDIVTAMTLLILVSPLIAVAAIAVRLDSAGPVFFQQRRVGRHGRIFNVLKIRSMVVDAEAQLASLREQNEREGPLFKMAEDPRVTKIGRILRKTSIDELPQLWNVVRGDMSLVAPLPALPAEAALWGPDLAERLRVRPGITGLWQVYGRGSSGFEEYERLDLFYIDNWSILTDVAIVLRTIPVVLSRGGDA